MRTLMIFAALAAAFLSGCTNSQTMAEGPPLDTEKVGQTEQPPLAEKIGLNCTVRFRRGEINISGQLRKVSRGWLVVERGLTDYWIPRESIRFIQIDKQIARRSDPGKGETTADPATTAASEGK